MTHRTPPHARPALAPLAACALLLACGATHASDGLPHEWFISGGAAEDNETRVASVGVAWPSAWERAWGGGLWTGRVELFVSHWNVRGLSGREGYTQLALVPLLRYRFAGGQSNWFAEGGIGVSFMDSRLQTPTKTMGLSFNFYDVLALGRNFGAEREHELSLRLAHVSNGGIKKPNPGENLLQLRYGRSF